MLIFVLFTNAMTNIAQFEYVTINYKSVNGLLGNQTRVDRMEIADESTELWRHPLSKQNLTCFAHTKPCRGHFSRWLKKFIGKSFLYCSLIYLKSHPVIKNSFQVANNWWLLEQIWLFNLTDGYLNKITIIQPNWCFQVCP